MLKVKIIYFYIFISKHEFCFCLSDDKNKAVIPHKPKDVENPVLVDVHTQCHSTYDTVYHDLDLMCKNFFVFELSLKIEYRFNFW